MPRHAAGASFNSRRWTEAEARELLAALEQSGRSITAFAAARGLDPQRLYYWRRRVAGGDRITFRELVVRPAQSAPQPMPFEILLGSGHVVRVPPSFDGEALGRLLEVLRAC